MTFNLSVALRWVCYSGFAVGAVALLNPLIAVIRGAFDSGDIITSLVVAVIFTILAVPFHVLSHLSLEKKSTAAMILVRPALWVASFLVAALNVRMLLFFIAF
jgi:hypothetical protein